MKVALVYDRVNKWGGAERVMLALHQLFPDAPLFTSVYNPETAGWADDIKVIPSFLQHAPFAKKAHELYPVLMPIAFESFSFDEFDLVISVTSEAAKGIITKPQTRHICYCLTPTRYLWSGYKEYFSQKFIKILSYPAVSYLRSWDKVSCTRPDAYIAISNEVKERIKKYYHSDSEIIHPPVSLFEGVSEVEKNKKEGEYYLVVSRLVPYKRVDLAIKACNKMRKKLIIIGKGSEEKYLRSIAGQTITFIGYVSDDVLRQYYVSAKALLFPGLEDFGITMVEALGFGIPVIAYNKGGAKDIIKNKRTGILFDRQSRESLSEAILLSEKIKFSSIELQKHAYTFSQEIFKRRMTEYIANVFAK